MAEVRVDIHVLHDDGSVGCETVGVAQRFSFEQNRNVQRLYSVGSTAVQMIPGPVTSTFTMEGLIVAKEAKAELPKVVAKITNRFDFEE